MEAGHTEMLKWAIRNGCDYNFRATYKDVVEHGWIDLLECMETKDWRWNDFEVDLVMSRTAVKNGRLDILQ